VTFAKRTQLIERQSAEGLGTALRTLNTATRLVLDLYGDAIGTVEHSSYFRSSTATSALAHAAASDYLEGNPWVLPISLELLRDRAGILCKLDATLLSGPYRMDDDDDDILELIAPQRSLTQPVFQVDAEQLILGVRGGYVEPQADGTYAMLYSNGEYGPVENTGRCLRALMADVDDMYDRCLPMGHHSVEVPGCPEALLLERFGPDAYDINTHMVLSS